LASLWPPSVFFIFSYLALLHGPVPFTELDKPDDATASTVLQEAAAGCYLRLSAECGNQNNSTHTFTTLSISPLHSTDKTQFTF
jgi:hypothetical protein